MISILSLGEVFTLNVKRNHEDQKKKKLDSAKGFVPSLFC